MRKITSTAKCFGLILLLIAVWNRLPPSAANQYSWERAKQLYQSGNYTAALAELHQIPSGSTNPSVHYLLGMCYKGLGKPDLAKRELSWVATYATDATTKDMARDALGQLGTVAHSSTRSTLSGKPAGSPPAKVLIHDSVSETIRAAAQNGWRPCSGRCLNVSTPGWHHEHVEGHLDTENWHSFTSPGNPRAVTTGHWGEVFEENANSPVVSKGACPICSGTGWVRAQ